MARVFHDQSVTFSAISFEPRARLPTTYRPRWTELAWSIWFETSQQNLWRPVPRKQKYSHDAPIRFGREYAAICVFRSAFGIDHLRHAKFAGLREDKDARNIIKEHGDEARTDNAPK